MEKEYISIPVAKYALLDVIKALHICKLRHYAITMMDNDLVIRIAVEDLDEAVYAKYGSDDSERLTAPAIPPVGIPEKTVKEIKLESEPIKLKEYVPDIPKSHPYRTNEDIVQEIMMIGETNFTSIFVENAEEKKDMKVVFEEYDGNQYLKVIEITSLKVSTFNGKNLTNYEKLVTDELLRNIRYIERTRTSTDANEIEEANRINNL